MSSDTIGSPLSTASAVGRRNLERVSDYLLAASVASWAVLGVSASGPPASTRWAVTLLHLTVAYAIFRRAPIERLGSPRALMSAVPALIVAGLAFHVAAPLDSWPLHLEVSFAAGTAIAMWTFLTLGESFSVLPARRAIVTRGPYRFVRHPAYTGELIMILACVLSSPSIAGAFVILASLPLVGLRIHAEEELLSETDAYRRYRERVSARLIPCLW